MSKCDISIKFDRPDRTYRGGETVSGEVHVQVNKDITSCLLYTSDAADE